MADDFDMILLMYASETSACIGVAGEPIFQHHVVGDLRIKRRPLASFVSLLAAGVVRQGHLRNRLSAAFLSCLKCLLLAIGVLLA